MESVEDLLNYMAEDLAAEEFEKVGISSNLFYELKDENIKYRYGISKLIDKGFKADQIVEIYNNKKCYWLAAKILWSNNDFTGAKNICLKHNDYLQAIKIAQFSQESEKSILKLAFSGAKITGDSRLYTQATRSAIKLRKMRFAIFLRDKCF